VGAAGFWLSPSEVAEINVFFAKPAATAESKRLVSSRDRFSRRRHNMFQKAFSFAGALLLAGAAVLIMPGFSQARDGGGHGGGGWHGGDRGGWHGGDRGRWHGRGDRFGHHRFWDGDRFGHHRFWGYGYYPYYGGYYPYYGGYYPYYYNYYYPSY
jgi:hypothetical protein